MSLRGAQDSAVVQGGARGAGASRLTLGLGRDWQVLLISSLAVFMALLDVTIVNIAFPAIRSTFAGSSVSSLSWVLNAYNVVVAALLVPAGRLADRVGRRRTLFVGLGVFLAGSALCGAAPTAAALIGARIVQAVGAATLIPSSLGVVLEEVAPEKRAMATSVWAAAGAIAAAAGPSLGGVLVQSTTWRAAFLVNLVIALGMLPAPRVLRESRDTSAEAMPDFAGGALLMVAIGAVALGIVKAPDWGWGSDRVLGAWALGAVLLALLARRSLRHPAPVLEPAILRIRTFAVANGAFFVFSMGFYALLLGNIVFLTEVWRYSVLVAGFAVTPGPLMAAVAAGAGGHLTERLGPRAVAVPALLLFACACLLYRRAGATHDYLGHWLPAQLVSGSAIGLTFAGLTTASVIDLPAGRLATGTAVSTCFRQVGAVLGISGLVAVIGTPEPSGAMAAFQRAWLLMALSGAGAALLAAMLPRRGSGKRRRHPAARRGRLELPGVARRELRLHGHQLVYRVAGSGPAVLLVHGMLEDSRSWRLVIPELSRRHTVIAPDLLGHGESDSPAEVDYSPSGQATMLRDLLDAIGVEKATVVGHSLGGGIALSFAYSYPDRVQRLALISSGGLGREVHPLLRVLATPGGGVVVRLAAGRPGLAALRTLTAALKSAGARSPAAALKRLRYVLVDLADPTRRRALMRTLRAVIDRRGQYVSGVDRLHLLVRFPTLLIWGTRDGVIPSAHARAVAGSHPDAELLLLQGGGHMPHITHSRVVAQRLSAFVAGGPEGHGQQPEAPGVEGNGRAADAPSADGSGRRADGAVAVYLRARQFSSSARWYATRATSRRAR